MNCTTLFGLLSASNESLWESLAAWLLTLTLHGLIWLGLGRLLARRVPSAGARVWLWQLVVLGPLASASLHPYLGSVALPWLESAPLPDAVVARAEPAAPSVTWTDARELRVAAPLGATQFAGFGAADWTRAVVSVWAAGALILLARWRRDRRRLGRVLARHAAPAPASLERRARALARRAGLADLDLRVSSAVASPLAVGRRRVVLPARALEAPAEERAAMLAHELAHLRHRDPARLAVLGVLRAVLWPQVGLHFAARRLRDAIEERSDDVAATWIGGGVALARGLARVASWVSPGACTRSAPAMARGDSPVVRRVERLLSDSRTPATRTQLATLAAGALLAVGLLGCLGPGASSESGPQAPPPPPPEEAELEEPIEIEEVVLSSGELQPAGLPPSTPRVVVGPDDSYSLDGRPLGSGDAGFRALTTALTELSEALASEVDAGGLRVVTDPLILEFESGASARSMQKAMEAAAIAGIANLHVAGDPVSRMGVGPDRTIAVPLPSHDDLVEEVEEGEEGAALPSERVQIVVELVDGDALYSLNGRELDDLDSIADVLRELGEPGDLPVTIDARSGVTYGHVVRVLDAVIEAGVVNVTFVGAVD